MNIADTLKAAWAVIDRPEKWTQDTFARDNEGVEVASLSEYAVCWCSLGALNKTSDDRLFTKGQAAQFLTDVVQQHFDWPSIDFFNDTHSYEEVASLWATAIKLAEERGV